MNKGKIFLSGGVSAKKSSKISNDAYIYTPKKYSARKIKDMLMGRCAHRSILRYPYIYVTGGKTTSNDNDGTKNCERLNLVKKKWETIADMNIARHGHLIFEYG